MINLLIKLIYIIFLLPHFIIIKLVDLFFYILNKEWRIFKGFGLHMYVGMFGAGKTSSMVHDAYVQAKRYKDLTILTNMKLVNFPEHTKIIQMEDTNDIITAPPNTLILIDEISTLFNSRQYKKDGIPIPLLEMLLQVRKEHKMLYATAQRFQHVDALLRQITFSVRECSCWLNRWNWVTKYDAWEYENRKNALDPIPERGVSSFIQTNKIRKLYDTNEMIEKVKKMEFISSEEILERQGNISTINVQTEKKRGLFGLRRK